MDVGATIEEQQTKLDKVSKDVKKLKRIELKRQADGDQQGLQGPEGPVGAQGPMGPRGPAGPSGDTAPEGAWAEPQLQTASSPDEAAEVSPRSRGEQREGFTVRELREEALALGVDEVHLLQPLLPHSSYSYSSYSCSLPHLPHHLQPRLEAARDQGKAQKAAIIKLMLEYEQTQRRKAAKQLGRTESARPLQLENGMNAADTMGAASDAAQAVLVAAATHHVKNLLREEQALERDLHAAGGAGRAAVRTKRLIFSGLCRGFMVVLKAPSSLSP